MLDKKGAYWLQQLPRSLEERIVLIRHFFDVKIHSLGAKGKTTGVTFERKANYRVFS